MTAVHVLRAHSAPKTTQFPPLTPQNTLPGGFVFQAESDDTRPICAPGATESHLNTLSGGFVFENEPTVFSSLFIV